MTGLPRSIIKKYGVTKKAWAIYRGTTQSSHSRRTTRRSFPMARRRRSRGRSKGSGFMTPEIKGVMGAVLYDSLVSPMIPLDENTKNLVELGAGYFLRNKSGWIGATGKTLFILNGYALLRNLIGSKLGAITNPNGTGDYGGM